MPAQPILFVAREPDETLRTFLPVIVELLRRGQVCVVAFHHEPGVWARERLSELGIVIRQVRLPERKPIGGPLASIRLASGLSELRQLWQTRRLARRLIRELDPGAVVVIQDTLQLERFLVREANRHGRATIVIQWAFTFPQRTYDRLRQAGRIRAQRTGEPAAVRPEPLVPRPPLGRARSFLFDLAQRLLGVKFNLVNSYGGGEARIFAVMGEAFREQFLTQGVNKERIEVTGHPLHDAAFAQRDGLTHERPVDAKARYGLPAEARIILYATQPVLWRGVITRDELLANVLALGHAVGTLGPEFLLVIKLHPREAFDDYAPACTGELPIRVIEEADTAELIAVAEVFVSSSSSTVLLAMMLEKPIVTVNFNRVPHFDYFENIGGTLHTRSPSDAAEAFRLALFDGPTRARLASERARVLARYARFDGHATERLADLIQSEAAH